MAQLIRELVGGFKYCKNLAVLIISNYLEQYQRYFLKLGVDYLQ